MESFELIDNFFQIVVLLCAAAAAGIFALRRRSRDLLILSLAYACFAMGTIYYVLYLVIIGIWPQVFYVAEISWLAAWLFYLSAQILRTEGMKVPLFAPCRKPPRRSLRRLLFSTTISARLILFPHCFRYGGCDHVSLGISYTKRQLVPKKRLFYDHLRYVAGVVIFDF